MILNKEINKVLKMLIKNHSHIWSRWPWNSKTEIIVWSILTQMNTWQQVEKVIENLKISWFLPKLNILEFQNIEKQINKEKKFIDLIINSLQKQNIKWIRFVDRKYEVLINTFKLLKKLNLNQDKTEIRKNFLNIKWIGKETADNILCYWLDTPIIVIDEYTYRVLWLSKKDFKYDELRQLLETQMMELGFHDLLYFQMIHWAFVRQWQIISGREVRPVV